MTFDPDTHNPTDAAQALQVLAAFARTAPGRLPERVEKALAIADGAKQPPNGAGP